jgi:hypothetical protein
MAAGIAAVVVAAPDPGDAGDVTGAPADDALTVGVIVAGTVAEDVMVVATAVGSPVTGMVVSPDTPVVVEACEADEESSAPGDAAMGAARAGDCLRAGALEAMRARVELLMT